MHKLSTMEKKTIPLAHTTLINHKDMPLLKIVHGKKLKIFPRAVDQTKKVILNGNLVHQILFQGKRMPSLRTRTL